MSSKDNINKSAKQGIVITNSSYCENLVILKHFGAVAH